MITRIRRSYWTAAHLLLLGLAAIFAAMTVSSLVRSRLHAGLAGPRSRASGPAETTRRRPLQDYLAIARRSVFADPADAIVTEGETRAAPTVAAPGSLQLLGTGGYGPQSFAVIQDKKAKKQELVRIGEEIGGAELVEIGWRRVVLRRSGKDELMVVPPDLGVSAASGARKSASSSRKTARDDSVIKDLGDDRFMVARAEVDHQLQNLSKLFTQMRAVPNMKEGKSNGFRIFAIRRGSLFQKIGLKNNDVIQRINGTELTDPARAMSLFQQLKEETRLEVDVQRGGEPRTFSYEIR